MGVLFFDATDHAAMAHVSELHSDVYTEELSWGTAEPFRSAPAPADHVAWGLQKGTGATRMAWQAGGASGN